MPEPEDEQVRRLLADARHTDPVPADVAARLDRVLADLSREDELAAARAERAERAASDARRTRMRRTRGLLVAAAAVVAIGAGGSWVAQHGGSDSMSSGSSADSGAASDAGGSTASEAAPSAGAPQEQRNGQNGFVGPGTVRLTAAGFPHQVRRLVTTDPQALRTADSARPGLSAGTAEKGCLRSGRGRGARVAATYDGAPAVLVVRPVRNGARVADLYLCGSREPVRSVTVPVR